MACQQLPLTQPELTSFLARDALRRQDVQSTPPRCRRSQRLVVPGGGARMGGGLHPPSRAIASAPARPSASTSGPDDVPGLESLFFLPRRRSHTKARHAATRPTCAHSCRASSSHHDAAAPRPGLRAGHRKVGFELDHRVFDDVLARSTTLGARLRSARNRRAAGRHLGFAARRSLACFTQRRQLLRRRHAGRPSARAAAAAQPAEYRAGGVDCVWLGVAVGRGSPTSSSANDAGDAAREVDRHPPVRPPSRRRRYGRLGCTTTWRTRATRGASARRIPTRYLLGASGRG